MNKNKSTNKNLTLYYFGNLNKIHTSPCYKKELQPSYNESFQSYKFESFVFHRTFLLLYISVLFISLFITVVSISLLLCGRDTFKELNKQFLKMFIKKRKSREIFRYILDDLRSASIYLFLFFFFFFG